MVDGSTKMGGESFFFLTCRFGSRQGKLFFFLSEKAKMKFKAFFKRKGFSARFIG
jgi:hypothetical protein